MATELHPGHGGSQSEVSEGGLAGCVVSAGHGVLTRERSSHLERLRVVLSGEKFGHRSVSLIGALPVHGLCTQDLSVCSVLVSRNLPEWG